jgi:hypothetical protein
MSFLTAIPAELLSAAAQLEGIGNSLTAQNAGAAAPTSAIAPAAADPVSALQAGIFSTYGTLYQQIAAEAQTIQQQFVSTLGLSSGTYTQTEAANAVAAGPVQNFLNSISTLLGGPLGSTNGTPTSLSSNLGNIGNIGGGNWASAASDLLGMAGGGLLPSAPADAGADAAAGAGAADAVNATGPAGAGMGGMGGMGMVGGMGQANMVGKLSVPPSWAGGVPTAAVASPIRTVGWTAAAPQVGPGTIMPGMGGMGGARNSAGFGAPRYGVKPIVMPKATAV